MQLEQRLCDLKTRFTNERRPEPLPVEGENFLKSYHPQISISTNTGFCVNNRRSNQSGLDIRQLILAARNQKSGLLDHEVLKQLQPFLSVVEFRVCSDNVFAKYCFSIFRWVFSSLDVMRLLISQIKLQYFATLQ